MPNHNNNRTTQNLLIPYSLEPSHNKQEIFAHRACSENPKLTRNGYTKKTLNHNVLASQTHLPDSDKCPEEILFFLPDWHIQKLSENRNWQNLSVKYGRTHFHGHCKPVHTADKPLPFSLSFHKKQKFCRANKRQNQCERTRNIPLPSEKAYDNTSYYLSQMEEYYPPSE